MSNDIPRNHALPENPDLEHLKNEAKERLAVLRVIAPDTQLAEAQFQLARDYGFSSWRALRDKVEGPGGELSAYVGFYQHNPALIKNSYLSVTEREGYLLVERTNGAKFEVTRREDGRFTSPGLSAMYGFEKDGAGHVSAMTVDADGRHARLMRIEAAAAGSIDIAIAQAREEQRRPRTSVILPPDVLDRYVGHYASAYLAMEITRENTTLYAQLTGQPRITLSAEAENAFFYTMVPAQIHFRIEAGKAVALTLHQTGFEQCLARASAKEAEDVGAAVQRRLKEQQQPRQLVSVPADILDRYAGRYRIADVREMIVTAEEGHLYMQMTGQPRNELYPESEAKFFLTVVAAQVEFYLDHNKRVSHAVLHQMGRLVPMSRLEDKEAAA